MRRISRRLGTSAGIARWAKPNDARPFINLPAEISRVELSWPAPGQLRMRRIISRSRAIATGKYPSQKLGRWVHWESKVERDGQRLVDVAPHVSSFCEQPVKIDFGHEDGPLSHIPDLLVRFFAGTPWLVEFKDDDDPELEFAHARASLLEGPLASLGFKYVLAIRSSLRRKAYVANALWLRRHGCRPLDLVSWERARRLFSHFGSMTLQEFCAAAGGGRESIRAAAALILKGDIRLDMAEPIGPESIMSWCADKKGGGAWLSAPFGETKSSIGTATLTDSPA